MRYEGKLYRALNPIYAREPLSGRGAQIYGGRFNPKGTPALYLSISLEAAIREANQAGSLQPTTIVAYNADIQNVFDTRDTDAFSGRAITARDLADPGWRDLMNAHGLAPTQKFAKDLIAEDFHGLVVRSFAPGAGADDFNLVLWTWGRGTSAILDVIDDENRLKRF